MKEVITYQNYEEYKATVNRVLNKTVEDFVTIGYLLKQGRDTDILKDSGYADINEFAKAEYQLDASQVSRFIRINDKFAVGGYSDQLKEEYCGYGYAKLAIMLTLPDGLNEELSPALSKSEIQAVKEEIEEEQKITDIEVILEGEKEEQKELNNLGKGLHQLFEDVPELFARLYDQEKEAQDLRSVQEILAPDGEKVYSVRVQGYGRIMMLLKDSEDKVTVFKVRSSEREYYPWDDVMWYIDSLIVEKSGKERWEELYGKTFPGPEKEEIAPVQPEKPKPRKESKVKKAKKPEPTKKTEEKKEEITPVQESVPDLVNTESEAESEQAEGQTELTKDFPQYCPERPAEKQEISVYGSRKQFLDEKTAYGAALYMAASMRTMPHVRLTDADFWERWLSEEVDERGERIEVVE